MSNNITPSIKLSNAQRRVALYRIMDKQSKQPQAMQGGIASPPIDMASSIANGQMSQMSKMSQMTQKPTPPAPMDERSMPTMPPPQETIPMPEKLEDPIVAMNQQGTPGELSSVDQHIQYALIADQLWKESNASGVAGKEVWGRLKKASGKSHLDSPRDYFISSFIKYNNDPVKFRKSHPNESRIIKQLKEEFDASQVQEIMPSGLT
jgi:hypothetical protein